MTDPRLTQLVPLLMKQCPANLAIEDALEKIKTYMSDMERTHDIYFDFANHCAKVLIAVAEKLDPSRLTEMNTVRKMTAIVINWGVYPHIPKSLHIPCIDEPHWIETRAPTRLLRPEQQMLDAVQAVIRSDGCFGLHGRFLEHAICIFHYLDREKIPFLIENQRTEVIITTLFALLSIRVNLMSLLSAVVAQRSDSLEALEGTGFPPQMCARAISAPPAGTDESKYYNSLFPKLRAAMMSKKGGILAKCVMSIIIDKRIEQFLANFPLDILLNWPNERSIGPVIFDINSMVFIDDVKKVLFDPIPQRIVLIAACTVGEVHHQSVRLLQSYMKEEKEAVSLVRSIVGVASLCPLGLDSFKIMSLDDGIFAYANDDGETDEEETEPEDSLLKQLAILEQMRAVIASCIDLKHSIPIIQSLPASIEGFHFLSELLRRYSEINPEVAATILAYVAKLTDFQEQAVAIAREVLEMCPTLKTVQQSVLDSFLGAGIPELCLLDSVDGPKEAADDEFDKEQMIRDLCSPIVPLRARGLYTLRKGVMTKNHPLRNEEEIKSLFPSIEKQLAHKDSFVFMNAIQVLESIAIVYPHLVVDKLTAQFPQKDVEVSLKVGQVLMLCARRNGPGLVHSSDGNLCGCFIKAFARGCEHDSDLIQASSLSDLATFVETLKFGIAPWFTDIIATLNRKWQIHNSQDVRRSSSYLAYRLVQTLGSGFEEFAKPDLMVLIDCVKRMRDGETDDVAHQNAEDCYQTLWEICPMLL